MTVGPFLPGISTGAISSLNFPASIAAIGLRDATARANSSCCCARDPRLLRRVLRVAAHVDVAERAPEPVLDHPVDHRLIAELDAAAHSIDVVRRVRHRLLPAGDDDLRVARLDRLRGEHHGLEARAAHLVDRERRDGGRMPALIAAWRAGAWPTPPWITLPMITSSIACVDAGALDRRANRDGAKLRRGQRREAAEKPADRRAGSRNDDTAAGMYPSCGSKLRS